jgi:hypothetical protein
MPELLPEQRFALLPLGGDGLLLRLDDALCRNVLREVRSMRTLTAKPIPSQDVRMVSWRGRIWGFPTPAWTWTNPSTPSSIT